MNLLLVNVTLAMVWAALTGQFSLENLIVGFLLGYLTLFAIRRALGPTEYFSKGYKALRFLLYFFWELLLANIRVARDVLWPGPIRMTPRVIAVPLEPASDMAVMVLANVISLTPGSLSLDVSDDRRVLFVHSIYAPDAEKAKQDIKRGFERMIFDLYGQKKSDSLLTKEASK